MYIPISIQNTLELCLDKSNRIQGAKFNKYKNQELLDFLEASQLSVNDLLYCINHQLKEIPSCPICGKQLHNLGKTTYCSKSCASKANKEERTKKIKQTKLEKYGSETYCNVEKIKKTFKEKYGSDSYFQTEQFQEKRKKTCLEKYGYDHYGKDCSVIEKRKQTCLEKYGVYNVSKVPEISKKASETFQKNYDESVQEKRKQTLREKTGFEHPLQNPESLKKQQQTCFERYGNAFFVKSEEGKKKQIETERKRREQYWEQFNTLLKEKNIEFIGTKDEYVNGSIFKFKCTICNQEWIENELTVQHIFCPNCKQKQYSIEEKQLFDWIKSVYNGTIIENDRTVISPKELDIYFPEKKLAIEFNGIYWHTDEFVEPLYHHNKSLNCREQGIRLIHIFENEWLEKQDICKSIILNALGLCKKKIYARKCVVKEIDQKIYTDFLDKNHIQGKVYSEIKYGLFYQNELVSVIGFGKSRFKKNEIELHRFCSKLNCIVIGGFSKLIKHSNIKDFVSYVDLSHFDGSGYTSCGFKEISITKPSYFYVKKHNVISRQKAQKHKLSCLLDSFDESLTAEENLKNNGYKKINTVGNLKVIYQK